MIRKAIAWRGLALAFLAFPALAAIVAAPGISANTKTKTKPTEVPAKVIAHLPLASASGSQMLLQKRDSKQFLYVQKASKDRYTVIDVTKPGFPSVVNRASPWNDGASGKLELVGPDVAIAEIRDKNSQTVRGSYENLTETVKILDLSDPAHPKALQTFNDVTSLLQDDERGLIYLTNKEGLWILKHTPEQITPARKKPPCDSASAIAAMPPDCQ